MSIKAGDIYDRARFFLNDTAGDEFDNATLEPALKTAYEDIRLECEDANIPFTNKTSAIITVPAGVTAIGANDVVGSPALPDDLIDIVEVYERTAGSTNDFMMMKPTRFLPKTSVITAYLEMFAWQGQVIKFLGSTSDIEVKIDYVANTLSRIINENTEIYLNNCINALSFRTAALAALYIGENKTRSDDLNAEAQRCVDIMENIAIKNQQSMPVRRRPFRRGRTFWRAGGFAG